MTARRILIVYGSTYGQTAKIARYIQDVLVSEGHEVVLEAADRWPAESSIQGFEAVIVGASIIIGKHQKAVSRFVAANRAALNRIPSAFFSVSGSAGGTDTKSIAEVDRIINDFLAGAQWHPRTVEKVAGAIVYTKYSWPMRQVMRWIVKGGGGPTDTTRDHELTDWAQVRRFAHRVLELVVSPAVEPAAAAPRAD